MCLEMTNESYPSVEISATVVFCPVACVNVLIALVIFSADLSSAPI